MASPLYTLDKSHFNSELYKSLRDLWFPGMENATSASKEAIQRWFGMGLSDAQKEDFDSQCHGLAISALNSISPSTISLPPFTNYEGDISRSSELAGPLLTEVRDAQAKDPKAGTETLLSLILLLDQMPRNIYRTPSQLPLVYDHYDRLALSLLYSAMSLPQNPVDNPFFKRRPVYTQWLLMPLIHAEHIPSHALWEKYTDETELLVKEAGDQEALDFLAQGRKSQKQHVEILRKFGRYPHRNEGLGRKSTEEEVEWLKTGETFGVAKKGEEANAKVEL
ncbi:hypothetical protein B0A48_13974 [Cryoendolithus antarcticus]|uniref:DUF924-domain-containing protein n=1 Tax=Cryoendolithus antarcticus TaxID=1507870 RepID=A0A1V8SLZ6_9PEZI|nr:hypothetical protein B0A48_13974 [Cryoendolithus antarcticus]